MIGIFAAWLLTVAVTACAGNSRARELRPSDKPVAGAPATGPDAGQAVAPPGDPTLIPARIRRLSNAEYNASASQLLQQEVRAADAFAPDSRQSGFTVNDAQRVDPVLAKQLFAAAEQLAADARSRFASQWPCATPDDPEACAREFIARFGARAYRRPLTTEESDGLLAVYRVGATDGEGDSHEAGLELVVRAVLQSAGFLYLTELGPPGDGPANATVQLEPAELASSLSYLVTGGPPDDALRQAAEQGELASPEGREAQLRRLYGGSQSLDRMTQVVREWLELDRIESTAKDSTVYPQYDGLRDAIVHESRDFVRAVLDPSEQAQSDVEALLGADWTVNEGGLQNLYTGARDIGNGRLSLPERRGVLNQGAFLSVKAHAHESTPVLRGVMVARRLSCLQIPSPSSLNIDVVPPVPDPSQTTRQRFAAHTADPQCAQCHRMIDGLGNAFEQYDGMGMFRSMENGLPVDSTTTVDLGNELDGDYPDSNALALALAHSDVVRECFARHVFRAAAARSGPDTAQQEDAFIDEWKALSRDEQGNLVDTLAVFVRSALFTQRGAGR